MPPSDDLHGRKRLFLTSFEREIPASAIGVRVYPCPSVREYERVKGELVELGVSVDAASQLVFIYRTHLEPVYEHFQPREQAPKSPLVSPTVVTPGCAEYRPALPAIFGDHFR